MKTKSENTTQPDHRLTIGRRMALGAAAGLILILFFVLSVDNPDPNWPKLWMVKPLIVAPLAGLIGGLSYHIINPSSRQPGWKRIGANLFGLLIFLIALWMGTVLGLNGTMWD